LKNRGVLIKPYKIAVFLIAVQGMLAAMVFWFPEDGISIGKENSLVFSKPKDFYQEKTRELEVISEVERLYSLEELEEDTLLAASIDSSILKRALILDKNERIVHPSDFENGLYSFYRKLSRVNQFSKPLRIMHFGDSQLEGDRISGVIRENLQNVFGGCGVGFIPISETNTGRLSVLKEENGWERYQVFGNGRKGSHSRYGFMGYYYKVGRDTIDKKTAEIEIRKNRRYFKKAQNFEQISLLYANSAENVDYELKTDTGTVSRGNLVATKGVKRRIWQMNGFSTGKISLFLETANSPDFYGVSLDCRKGVAVDNIALRGSSGTDFTKIDKEYLSQQLKSLNVGLIIFQFGLNVVPSELKNYSYYEKAMYNQLKLLKEILPDASILVISVTDACKNKEESYANIDKVRDAQLRAAKRANCSFWDLYSVMGGEYSMPSWVNANPSLAEKDFKHFNSRGAKVIGNKLFNAIISDYNDYKSTNIN
tara:strand:- start:15142 stop:16587 length:1446 start_codon:yes stop_codon:yes gene_type:complete